MASKSLDRDYETAWPLLKTMLKEASQEPGRVAAREGFFNLLTVSREIVAATTRRRAAVRRREVQRAGDMLTALDAFAASARIVHLQNIDVFQGLDVIEGSALRVLWWIEAWERCRTDRDRGEQALITLLWLRGRGSVVQRISAHLECKAEEAETNRQYDTAHRLRVGILLCDHDPTRQELTELDRRLAHKDPEAAPTERQHAKATGSAASKTNAFIVYLNRLADVHEGSTDTQYSRQPCQTLSDLEQYIARALRYARLKRKAASKAQIVWHIGMDLVGVLNGCKTPGVHYYKLTAPNPFKRRRATRTVREWDDDLHDFLERKLGTITVWDFVCWYGHAPTEDKAKAWLAASPKRPRSLKDFQATIMEAVSGCTSAPALLKLLTDFTMSAQLLAGRPHATRYGRFRQRCRAVNRHAQSPKDKQHEDLDTDMVILPEIEAVLKKPHLQFNRNYNYILVDHKTAR